MPSPVPRQRRRSLAILGQLAALAVATFAAVYLLDYFILDPVRPGREGVVRQLFDFDA